MKVFKDTQNHSIKEFWNHKERYNTVIKNLATETCLQMAKFLQLLGK